MSTAVFSIISPNRRRHATVLMASLRRLHPEWDRFVALVDDMAATRPRTAEDDPFTTVPLSALGLPQPRLFSFRYTLLELNTAVKPWMFAYLFARGYTRVVYFDPDIEVYSPLVELDAAPPDTFLVLTPHLTRAAGLDRQYSELAILQAGAWNLGFLAVCRQPCLTTFLDWWQERLEHQCVVDVERGLFVDQKWMDLAPGLFPGVHVLRHEGCNVAYWNLRQRTVTSSGDSWSVNGQPLRFFHFSGLDPALPEMVSRHDGRLRRDEVGAARQLLDAYAAAIDAAGPASIDSAPYAFAAFSDGSPIPDAARAAYRHSTDLQRGCGENPFAHPELFEGIRDHVRTHRSARLALTAYRVLSRPRAVVGLLPQPIRAAMRDYLLGRAAPTPRPVRLQATAPTGLNIVGYVARENGVGESARVCERACEQAELPSRLVDVEDAVAMSMPPTYRTSLFHVNADQITDVHRRHQRFFASGSHNIGCWHWELPELPDAWIASAEPLDEIWAPSAFIQSTLSRKLPTPVVHMPHGVEVTAIERCTPQELGVADRRFTFLCLFSLDSVMARKNPFGALDAFERAFGGRATPASLLIKVSGAHSHAADWAALVERIGARPNVHLTDRALPRARVNGLIAACDAVLSLHRAEGFGLVLAEAMALGKPVVATGWSGNMDFMNDRNSCPVGYELVTLDRTHLDYHAGQQWAEPDVDHAAHLMRRLIDDEVSRAETGERAAETIRSNFSPAAAGRRYRRRLALLG